MKTCLLYVLYPLALLLYLSLSLPKILFQRVRYGKYRGSILSRISGKGPSPKQDAVIWFHAVSVGEVKALKTLIPLFKREKPHAFILISTVTGTGLAVAKKEIPEADAICYLPLDFPWTARRFVHRLKPDLLILIEGDYWFNLIREVKKRGGRVVVASGKLSEKSFRRHAAMPLFSRPLFRLIDHFYLQHELYAKRFARLNIPSEKITVAGNLKFDLKSPFLSPLEKKNLYQKWGLSEREILIVIGSTHAQEEKELLLTLLPLKKKHTHLKFLLLPRHPERFLEVEEMLKKENISYALLSKLSSPFLSCDVLFIDQIGILPTCYQLGDLAIVGGSYVPGIGGHDIVEPAKLGVPVLFGPYMETQTQLKTHVLKAGAGKQTHLNSIAPLVDDLLSHPDKRKEMGERGKQLAASMEGVAERHFTHIIPLLPE